MLDGLETWTSAGIVITTVPVNENTALIKSVVDTFANASVKFVLIVRVPELALGSNMPCADPVKSKVIVDVLITGSVVGL
jgi:hypothetical protein